MKVSVLRNLNKLLILAIVLFGIVGAYFQTTVRLPAPAKNEPPLPVTEVSPRQSAGPNDMMASAAETNTESKAETPKTSVVETVPAVSGKVTTAVFPVKGGEISKGMGWYQSEFYRDWRYHGGIDIKAPEDAASTPVYCCTDGVIDEVQKDEFMGAVVVVTAPDGLRWSYAGLSSARVSKGDKVAGGSVIGELTGAPAAEPGDPHLHLEVWKGGEQLDPSTCIETR